MATNRSLEKILIARYPNTIKHLQQLLIDAESCAKNYGKKTWLGKDKFESSFDKFMSTIGLSVYGLIMDGQLDDPENTTEAMAAIDLALSRSQEVYSNWPLAFKFWNDYYSQFQAKLAAP